MLGQIWGILKKDIVIELRTREMLISMFLFVMLTMIIFNISFNAERTDLTRFGGGMLWLAFTFTSMLGLNRSFVHEKDEGCLDGLLISPIDRSVIYASKVLSNLIFLSAIEIITIPIFSVLFVKYNYLPKFGLFVLGVILSNIGISSVGTFLSTIAVNTRNRDLLLPILFLPMIYPAIMGAVTISGAVMGGPYGPNIAKSISDAVLILIIYDIVFLVVSYGFYDFVIGE